MEQIKALKITTLAENLVQSGGLGQWGLSFLLDVIDSRGEKKKILFDTGSNKEAFLHNVKLLKVNLRDVDSIVISHGHGDHTSATVEVVQASGGVKVYGHPHTFLPRFYEDKNGKRRRAGPPKGEGLEEVERAGGEIMLTPNPVEVVKGLWTTGQVPRTTSFEKISPPTGNNGRRIIVVDGEEITDQIHDDQALWMDIKNIGPFVVTGCAHAGSVNTLLHVKKLGNFNQIKGLVGGTHLVRRSDQYIEQTIKGLKQFGLSLISPCHCTGFKATTRIWQGFPDQFVLNYCCRVIKAGKKPELQVI
jgi:7,8-dihydropterin-6-yl-methyl-4-(beta-D-ribofuranosyl)aminobenzene 5'-phosphate synthase